MTEPADVTRAREALVDCGVHTADDCGNHGPCRRPKGHTGFCDPVEPLTVYRGHLRAVLAHLAAVEAERDEAREAADIDGRAWSGAVHDCGATLGILDDEGKCCLADILDSALDARRERDEARAHVAELREHISSLHKATARGMEHERAAIVAWLRGWGSVGRVATADDYADAIEAADLAARATP